MGLKCIRPHHQQLGNICTLHYNNARSQLTQKLVRVSVYSIFNMIYNSASEMDFFLVSNKMYSIFDKYVVVAFFVYV